MISSPDPDPGLQPAQRRGRGRIWLVGAVSILVALAFALLWIWRLALQDLPEVPPAQALWTLNRPADVVFVDDQGGWIGERPGHRGAPLKLGVLPSHVVNAFLAAQDQDFERHGGVDLGAMARAVKTDMSTGRWTRGGSTVTQQLARDLFDLKGPPLRRKVQESVIAWRIEQRLYKADILALYLDRADFGAGAYGLEAASATYFGKSASDLSLAEAAFLAALPARPMRDPLDAAARTETVLRQMRKVGWITPAQFETAKATPLRLAQPRAEAPEIAALLDLAAEEARNRASNAKGVLMVTLPLDPRLQREAGDALRTVAAADAIVAAVDRDGSVSAFASSLDHRFQQAGRAMAPRPLGEVFAPFIQAAALEADLSPDDPADRLAARLGAPKLDPFAKRFGLARRPGDGFEANPVDLAAAYQALRDGGRLPRPFLIRKIVDARGDLAYARAEIAPREVYAAALSRQMTAIMQRPIDKGPAGLGRPAAGTGGPAEDGKDGWFAGFTPDTAAAVWSRGGADGGAARLWRAFMTAAEGDRPARSFAADTPDTPPANARASFYTGLAAEFDRLARDPARP